MDETLYTQLLNLAVSALLLTAILVLWRRELTVAVRLLAWQGSALTALVAVRAAHENSVELWIVALGVAVLRVGILPWLLRRALTRLSAPPLSNGNGLNSGREKRPRVNIASSLLVSAALALVSYTVSQPLVKLMPSATTRAIPIGFTVVLVGFFLMISRRQALSQLIGFLVLDNGITATGVLTTVHNGLVVELGIALDVLLVVLVLRGLTMRMQETFGDTDLDELRELRD